MTFHLINTSDERTWNKSKKNLFLGEWCLKYSKKNLLKNLNFEICSPILKTKLERKKAVEEVFHLVDTYLPKLSLLLNNYHKTNYSDRYWNILIGHWLIRFISTIYNRYYSLKYVLENYNISSVTFLKSSNYNLAVQDTMSFTYASSCEIWNNVIFKKIFEYYCFNKIEVNFVNTPETHFIYSLSTQERSNLKLKFKKFGFDLVSKFRKDNDALIDGSYLSLSDNIKLNYFFNQVPFFCIENNFDFNFNFNRKDIKVFPKKSEISLFGFLNEIIYSAIPVIFLENFSTLQSSILKLNWPKTPKFVFTSHKFDTDEIFKGWVAAQVEKSVPYFVGQHGNCYGQRLFEGKFNWPERKASSGFITWGWDDGYKNNIKGFNFKKQIKKNLRGEQGGLVLITTCVMFRFFPWDVVQEYKKNLEEQYDFLRNLSKLIFDKTIVRLHHTSLEKENIDSFGERYVLRKKFPLIKIDNGLTKLQSLVNQNKLFVFSYDGTGILEFLYSDIPFIAFWPNKKEHLLDDLEILKLYDDFYKVGIFFSNGAEAALTINKRWNEIENWWNSNEVKLAKDNFKKYFSLYKFNKHRSLAKIFEDNLKKM